MDSPILPPQPVMRKKKEGFWNRQFSQKSTRTQKIFDFLFGIIIPILLLIFDPIVFRDTGSCYSAAPIIGGYATFAYLAIPLGALLLLAWLLTGMGPYKSFAAGVFLTGTLFATIVGIAILPASIFGLFAFFIGALGFVPFMTALVYYRNGLRAYRTAIAVAQNRKRMFGGLLAGVIFATAIPALAQWQVAGVIQHSMDKIIANPSAPDASSVEALARLNTVCFHVCTPNIENAFQRAAYSQERSRQALSIIYNKITGEVLPLSCNTSD